jgi:uncharacterized RDD family membrane protein YckC
MTEPGTPAPVLPWEAPPESAGPAPGIEFAGHGARLVAYLLDTVLLSILLIVALIVGGGFIVSGATYVGSRMTVMGPNAGLGFFIIFIAVILSVIYWLFFWARGGQTPGMRVFGLHVVRDRDGSRIGWGTAILRLIGMYVASTVFYLGFVWIFIDKRRRGWHDLIAGTVVIKRS